jgi:hypothetical protein
MPPLRSAAMEVQLGALDRTNALPRLRLPAGSPLKTDPLSLTHRRCHSRVLVRLLGVSLCGMIDLCQTTLN